MSADESAAICGRVADGAVKTVGESGAGWLHRLHDRGDWRRAAPPRVIVVPTARLNGPDLSSRAWRAVGAVEPLALQRFAHGLGVSTESLQRLRVGWDGRAWTFPMWSEHSIVGIRRRFPNGFKCAVKGGREGLFLPKPLADTGPLHICEGPTDTAAMLDLGFAAIGRPSCTGGSHLVTALALGRDAVIVADADEPGQRGANALANALRLYCKRVRIITPPAGVKDARGWARSGATVADVQAAIDAAQPLHLVVKGVHRG